MFSRLYIHTPWCIEKCAYCGFYSSKGSYSDAAETARLILEEIKLCSSRFQGTPLDSIYFGGGTPSLLPPESIKSIISLAGETWGMGVFPEITLEANPGTISPESLCGFADAGINRLSLGIQSFNDKALSTIGRIHNSRMAREAFLAARATQGIKSISIDMICGLPEQTMDDWLQELDAAVDMEPDHISLYALSIEDGSRFACIYSSHEAKSTLPDSDMVADMLEQASISLCEKGYEHYEISSFARPGHRSRHNSGYWKRDGYLGLGPAAHSLMLDGWGRRFSNPPDITAWGEIISANRVAHQDIEQLSPDAALSEHLFLGLRMSDGISEVDIINIYGDKRWLKHKSAINSFVEHGLMICKLGRYSLTESGMMLSNQILSRFV